MLSRDGISPRGRVKGKASNIAEIMAPISGSFKSPALFLDCFGLEFAATCRSLTWNQLRRLCKPIMKEEIAKTAPGFDSFVRAFEWAYRVGRQMAKFGRAEPIIYMLNISVDSVSCRGRVKIAKSGAELNVHLRALQIAADLEDVDIAVYLRCDVDIAGSPVMTIHLMSKYNELSTLNLINALTGILERGFLGPELLQMRQLVIVRH